MTTHKRCELPFIFAAIGQAVRRLKALNLRSLNMQFQQDWPKDKKLQLFKFFTRKLNLEKFCSTDLYDAPLEGSKVQATRAKRGYHS